MTEPLSISLHLGVHKTASTHLQKSLQRSPGKLAPAGITFRGPKYLRDPDHKLAQVMRTNGPDLEAVFGADPLHQMAGAADRLVLSDENLLGLVFSDLHPGMPYPRARGRIERLLAALAPSSVQMFLAVRDPASWLVSLYSQRIKGGHYMSFADFCAGFSTVDLQWSGLIRRLLSLDHHQGITIWQHENYSAVGDSLLKAMLGRTPPKGVKLLHNKVNKSISAAAIDHLLSKHGQGEDMPGNWGKDAQALYPLSEDYPAFDPWSEEEKQASRAAYQADLEQIRTLPHVTFLSPE